MALKLLLGGSPCTFWSIAQKANRETEAEGMGWELFKNYLIARDKYRPDFFLYENNKSMARAIRDQIDREFTRPYTDSEDWVLIEHADTKGLTRWMFQHWLTCETVQISRILINSALLSAQNRERYYWTNIPAVEHPADLGILLRDVLETGEAWRDKGYTIDANYFKTPGRIGFDSQAGRRKMVAEPVCVSQRGRYEDTGRRNVKGNGAIHQHFEARPDGKTNTLTTVQKDNFVAQPVRIGTIENDAKNPDHDSQQCRVYSPNGKAVTLCGNGGGVGAKTGLYAVPVTVEWRDGKTYPVYEVVDGQITIKDKTYPIKLADGFYIIRKLTVTECKRLQTVPDDYFFPVSNAQAYKMLGNGWTVDVIAHILSHAPGITEEPLEVLSMYDGMGCGRIALNKLGATVVKYYATEIDKYAVQTAQHNFPDTMQLGDAFQVRADWWTLEGVAEIW